MKKILLAVIVLLMVSVFSHSLDAHFGIKVGAGYSTFVGNDWEDILDELGLNRAFFLAFGFGAFVTLSLSEHMAIEPEALFLRVGGADDIPGVGKEIWISNYLAPAVLIKATSRALNLFAGPAVMIKLGSGKYKYDPDSGSSTTLEFADDALTNVLFAATAGIGFQYPTGFGKILGELRAVYSFTCWYNQDLVAYDWKPLAILAMVGYSFPSRSDSRIR
jgi:pimeloyl-ACP methyl ester carboxylesterase